jgi:WbqC-like protein family
VKAVILQSNYIPWKGYFDLIHDADVFIYYDEVQYTKNDWRNRNRIYTRNGLQWLTIPVGTDATNGKISDVELKDAGWQQQHYKSLSMGYARAPYYSQLAPLLEKMFLENTWKRLVEVNRFATEYICQMIGIETIFKDSADFNLDGERISRLINLVKQAGADTYLSGPAARNYLAGHEHLFGENNIRLEYKDYPAYPAYKQLKEPFEAAVSIIDLIANVERNQIKNYIWAWRS